jgi:hypothetical protein
VKRNMREIFVECDVYNIFLTAASFFQKGVPEYREGRARNQRGQKRELPLFFLPKIKQRYMDYYHHPTRPHD